VFLITLDDVWFPFPGTLVPQYVCATRAAGTKFCWAINLTGNPVTSISLSTNADIDGDGINNNADNCYIDVNASQLDNDNDDQGDVCDTDDDNDGVLDTSDSFPLDATRSAGNSNILFTRNGDSASDWLGYAVSGAGDVNGDGYPDVIVGAYGDDNNGAGSGSARIYSGLDSSILYTFNGDSAGDELGISVSGAGDVNSDGYADVILGAYGDDNTAGNAGSARVFSGINGNILYTFNGDSGGDFFGYSVDGAGDVNNDGYADIIVGAYGDDNIVTDTGSARVFSGSDGSVLYTFIGDEANDHFGLSVGSAGDINNDGYADVIVGANQAKNTSVITGSARVFSGMDGSVLYTFYGDNSVDYFGGSVGHAGDVNNDGYDDVIVGANGDDNNGNRSGSARVFSGANGDILYTFNGDHAEDYFGQSVAGAGDVDKDGYDDVMVGAYRDDNNGNGSGSARVLSGIDGSILYTLNGDSTTDSFGVSVSGAGDVNADGYADVIVGAYEDDNNGSSSGSARVFSGRGLWTNLDGDSQNDAVDTDDDNDGVLDINDFYPLDTDNDGINNGIDWDDDNDGVPDTVDAAPLNSGDASEITLPLNSNYKGLQLKGVQDAIH